jgi:hypothetical protein
VLRDGRSRERRPDGGGHDEVRRGGSSWLAAMLGAIYYAASDGIEEGGRKCSALF